MDATMPIGELAERTGASVRSLRYYEEQGLLASERTAGGQRRYSGPDVERVAFIRRFLAAGLSTGAVRAVLPCLDRPGAGTTGEAWARLAAERDGLDAQIRSLVETRDLLDRLVAGHDCGPGTVAPRPGTRRMVGHRAPRVGAAGPARR